MYSEASIKWAQKKIATYKTTDSYLLLMEQIGSAANELSEDALFRLLAYSADIYYRIQYDAENHKGLNTFYNKLSSIIAENPLLFSIYETVNIDCAVRYIIFFRSKWLSIVEKIISSYSIEYNIQNVNSDVVDLKALTFFQTYKTYSDWEAENRTRSSLAQEIHHKIQEENGISADLFSLYLGFEYRASLAILSPGSTLKLLIGKERDSQSFFRNDLRQLFRSSWEANVARVLNKKGVSWKYEDHFYDLSGGLMYLPDFFLPNDVILEVKGYWDQNSRDKVITFSRDNPQISLQILDSDMYYSLERQYGTIIPEWEGSNSNAVYPRSETINIVGMRFCASKQTLNSIQVGSVLNFIREPENKYDKNAILALTEDGNPLGHVSSDWAFIYAVKMDLGMQFIAEVSSIEAKVIRAKIHRLNMDDTILYDYLQ